MMTAKERRPVVESAVIWFPGYGPESEWFAPARDAGGFVLPDGWDGRPVDDDVRVWPAAVELGDEATGRRLGIDVSRSCVVVEVKPGGLRVAVNLDAIAAVLQIGRQATGQA